MATKASGTLVLIIEKQHASWGLMCSTLPALELRFRRQPHIASARPLVGPSGPCTIVVVCACVELTNGLLLAFIPSSGLLRLGWQQLDTHLMGWVQISLIRCPDGALGGHRALRRARVRWSHMCKWDL